MRYFFLFLLLAFTLCGPGAGAQHSLQLFQVDTADRWSGTSNYFNAITLAQNRIVHSYINRQNYNAGNRAYGEVKINTYNTQGVLSAQERTLGDSLFITKTLLKANGEQIILGNGFRHLGLYRADTILNAISGESRSFILHLSAANQILHYGEFAPVSDMALDEATNKLYFTAQQAYDSANVYAWDLSTGQSAVIATIGRARLNARILKTKDFIYIAGATINFGVSVNSRLEPITFPYGTFVIQLNNNGSFNWIKVLEDATTPKLGLAAAPGQGVYMSSDLMISLVIGADSLAGPGWGGDFVLTRLDSLGNFRWARDIPALTSCGFTLGTGAHLGSDNDFNVYLAGNSRGLIRWPDSTTVGRSTNALVPAVLIYDKDGRVAGHVIAEAGESGYFHAISVAANGDFAVSGKMATTHTFSGITRTVTDGGYHPYFLYYKNATTGIGPVKQAATCRMYPNPVNGHAFLFIEQSQAGTGVVELFNTMGQQVLKQQISGTLSQLPMDGISPGLYYVRLNGGAVQKLLVQ